MSLYFLMILEMVYLLGILFVVFDLVVSGLIIAGLAIWIRRRLRRRQ